MKYLSPETYKLEGFYCGIPHNPKLITPTCKAIICIPCFVKQNFYCPLHQEKNLKHEEKIETGQDKNDHKKIFTE